MLTNVQLEAICNQLLEPDAFKDYSPNGLQVEGRTCIRHLVTGVTASQALIDAVIARDADAILVHHGYFWGNEAPSIRGMKKRRLQALLGRDINLLAYHLPLDAHPQLGNNAQLARLLDIRIEAPLEAGNPRSLALVGSLAEPLSGAAFAGRLASRLGRTPLHCGDGGPAQIRRLAWCTGGGQGYLMQAAEQGLDAFVTGEASEQSIHIAREMGIHFFAAGHHATERYGVQALGNWLAAQHGLQVSFIDIDNPV